MLFLMVKKNIFTPYPQKVGELGEIAFKPNSGAALTLPQSFKKWGKYPPTA
jgi:hypothetical protein